MADYTLDAFRRQLSTISREAADRMALIEKRASESLTEATEKSDKQMKTVEAVMVRLNDRNRRIREEGGWDRGDRDQEQAVFGAVEDEEDDAITSAPGYPPPASEPRAPGPAASRHPRRDDDFDEDDYAVNNWLR